MTGALPDLSVVIIATDDDLLGLNVALLSAIRAIEMAHAAGWSVEPVIFHAAEAARTAAWVEERLPGDWRRIAGAGGCLGAIYGQILSQTRGRFLACLEGRDAWCGNWLAEALPRAMAEPAVWRPQLLAVYGPAILQDMDFSFHLQGEADTTPERLLAQDPFPSGFLTSRALLEAVPVPREDRSRGLGEVLWWWNCNIAGLGHAHRIVPDTLHYRRADTLAPADSMAQKLVLPLRIGPTPLARRRNPLEETGGNP